MIKFKYVILNYVSMHEPLTERVEEGVEQLRERNEKDKRKALSVIPVSTIAGWSVYIVCNLSTKVWESKHATETISELASALHLPSDAHLCYGLLLLPLAGIAFGLKQVYNVESRKKQIHQLIPQQESYY